MLFRVSHLILAGGMIFSRIPLGSVKMPGLVGMLVLGFVIRNAWPAINGARANSGDAYCIMRSCDT